MDQSSSNQKGNSSGFFRKIVMPAVLALTLFVLSMFLFILPAFESNAIEQKKTMLHELTNTAWSILYKYNNDYLKGILSAEDARQFAIEEVRALRYGLDKKDYFWITDLEPTMIMHPYVDELTGKKLDDYVDPDGKQLFIEAARIARTEGEGFIRYKWQFKDDSAHIMPKLSFVKRFEPWNWIIGTGIYLDDVQTEIAILRNKMILILGGISLIIGLLIAFTTIQSHRIEQNRMLAEHQLHESREKYKSLIESTTEGIILLLSEKIAYSNLFIRSWTGYSENELAGMLVSDFIKNGDEFLLSPPTSDRKVEVKLIKKDGNSADAVLTMLPVEFAEKKGVLITLKDVAEHYTVKTELEKYRTRFDQLSNKLPVGIIRFPLFGRERDVEYNYALAKILGYNGTEELRQISLIRILGGKQVYKSLLKELIEKKIIDNKVVKLVKKDETEVQVRLTLVMSSNSDNVPEHCDGIIQSETEDILHLDQAMLELFQLFFQEGKDPARKFAKEPCTLSADARIGNVIELFRNFEPEVVLITMQGRCIGIITDKSLKRLLIDNSLSVSSPAAEIMTAPVVTAPDYCTISEAFSIMEVKSALHLVLVKSDGDAAGVLSKSDLVGIAWNPLERIAQIITKSSDLEMFAKLRHNAPLLTASLMDAVSGLSVSLNTLSAFNTVISRRIIELCLLEMGPCPVPFSFIVFGGAGRNELAFNSDQDNAIIYDDVDAENAEVVTAYFNQLAQKITKRLDVSGLQFCTGKYMASNHDWCQPISVWKNYFSRWINEPEPENILNFSVFFDMDHLYGDKTLFNRLEDFIYHELKGKSAFYYFLAQAAINVKPPINLFGNLITESSSRHEEKLDVKQAISMIVMFARTFALFNQIRTKSTLGRLGALHRLNILSNESHEEADFHFRFLMHHRLKIQSEQLLQGKKPDNYLNVKGLSEMDQMILKKVFTQMASYQTSLNAAFMSAYKG